MLQDYDKFTEEAGKQLNFEKTQEMLSKGQEMRRQASKLSERIKSLDETIASLEAQKRKG